MTLTFDLENSNLQP